MIVLFTDFGLQGPYTGQMKAVLHQRAPGVPTIDLLADAPVGNPKASAYLLAAYAEWFAAATVLPWTSDGFRASWGKACKRAGIADLTFHDLRGTAVTRLAICECTEAEIATITGHSLRSVRAILDTHYLSRDPALAESAIRKLERGTKTPD
jgi:integrase